MKLGTWSHEGWGGRGETRDWGRGAPQHCRTRWQAEGQLEAGGKRVMTWVHAGRCRGAVRSRGVRAELHRVAAAAWGQEDGRTCIPWAQPPHGARQASALHRPCRAVGQSGPSQDPCWGPGRGSRVCSRAGVGRAAPSPSRTCTRSIGSSPTPTWGSPCVPGPHRELRTGAC